MPFKLTLAEIRQSFSSRSYQRGRAYQQAGRVLFAEWDEETQMLFGEVDGSGRNCYQQDIVISRGRRRHIEGSCTCPVGYNCKHVVAVLLEWVEENLDFPQPAAPLARNDLLQWMEETGRRLEQAQQTGKPVPGKTGLLYLLAPRRQGGAGSIELRTVKSRLLKSGGWGKCSDFDLRSLGSYYSYSPNSIALPQDKLIARMLNDPQQLYSARRPVLEGDVGQLVLQHLLASGRCFFESPVNPPLKVGPGRRLDLGWHTDKGLTRLKLDLVDGPEYWLLVPAAPAWYLDPKAHLCGPIKDQPLPSSFLASLVAMPAVAEEQLLDLSHFLVEKFPAGALTPPIELKLKVLDQPPVPTLTLHSVPGPTGARHHLMRLRFGYGPHSLPPLVPGDPRQLILCQGEDDWQIRRDPVAEEQAALDLRDYNLTAAGSPLATAAEVDLLFATDSLAASALAWRNFLAEIPRLREAGWRIDFDESFVLDFCRIESLHAAIEESETDWFALGLLVEHQGQRIELLPLVLQWLETERAPQQPLLHHLGQNRWLEIPATVIEPVIATLVELYDQAPLDEAGMLKLPRTLAHGLLDIEQQLGKEGIRLQWQGGEKVRQLAKKLSNFQGISDVSAPRGLAASLRDYQQRGLSWLQFLREYQFNGILADDMGLGKTIQTLSHLLLEKEAGRLDWPALIVAPTSVLSNWRREADRFAPGLRCLVLHGADRGDDFERLADHDLIVTSYALLTRDLKRHLEQSYHSLILDEAQAIKNPRAKTALAAGQIRARHRLCLTGTPLENHLGELWSLFQVLMPGFLGPQQQFTKLFRTPIERHGDSDRQHQLQERLAPFVLRRTKEQVARELPPKTVMIREAELGAAQGKLYESLRLAMVKKVSHLLQLKGLARSHIEILDALLKLRQVCCDPRLVKLVAARKVTASAKLDELMALLPNLLEEGRKILIFSQFTSMLGLIEEELQARVIDYSKLTGRTRKRDEAIAAFQEGAARVFLVSLKAGGVGLNLTAADTVIHYDPWWNPAAENQATDRAHRIGQDKPVLVYKLVAKGTIEEKILQLQEKKQQLADGVYRHESEKQPLAALNAEDILKLLTPLE